MLSMFDFPPFLLLRLIRDRHVRNTQQLQSQGLQRLGFLSSLAQLQIRRSLSQFEALELIQIDEHGNIEPRPKLYDFLEAFGLSLTKMINYSPQSLVIRPTLDYPNQLTDSPDVFVLMPFQQQLQPVYEDHIKKVVRELGMTIGRADDFFSSDSIINEIWSAMNAAKIIIADCTDKNPNVFYELGIAHTLGKPVILTSQSLDDIPFDLRHRRYTLYEYTPRGMKEFEKDLAKAVEGHLRRSRSFESIVERLDGKSIENA